MNYTLITPVKNEENNLPKLAECVINQIKKPKKWIIINDNSTDTTEEIIESLIEKYSWIDSIFIEGDTKRNFYKHFASIIRIGFDKSLENEDSIKYLIKIDADVRFDEKLFERMLLHMEKNKKLVVASPRLIFIKNELNDYKDIDIIKNKIASDNLIRTDSNRFPEPTDGIRIYRKEFLNRIEGYPVTDASDDIVLALAVMNGYTIDFIDGLWGYSVRQTGSTIGSKIEHGKFSGYRAYIEHFHPLMVVLRILSHFINSPLYGIGTFIGYFQSYINKPEKINDVNVIKYYRKERLRKLFNNFKFYKC